MIIMRSACLAIFAVWGLTAVFAADGPKLALPLACEPSQTCFIQSYVDHDSGPEARDYACGTATYDGHKGTDFRLLSAAVAGKGVAVLAAAGGVVKGMRDGMDDRLLPDDAKATVAGRECGNGVVIDTGGGWTTQYCHMKKGSVTVKTGDTVTQGQRLGDVGYSGLVEFAHVHLQVAKDGKIVDPFTGQAQQDTCSNTADRANGLWLPEVAAAFAKPDSEIIETLFTTSLPEWIDLEGDNAPAPPLATSSELVFVARIANIRKGDAVRVTILGPKGFKHSRTDDPLPRNRGGHLGFGVVKTASGGQLPEGTYTGTAELMRGDTVIDSKTKAIEIKR